MNVSEMRALIQATRDGIDEAVRNAGANDMADVAAARLVSAGALLLGEFLLDVKRIADAAESARVRVVETPPHR